MSMKIIIGYDVEGTMILNIYIDHYLLGYNAAVAEPMELKFRILKECEIHPPTLKLPMILAQDFLTALKEALEPHDKKREREIKLQVENKMLREQIDHLKTLLLHDDKGRRITL